MFFVLFLVFLFCFFVSQIQNFAACKAAMDKKRDKALVTKNMFCAYNNKTNEDTCPQDSGSPIVQQDPTSQRYTALGITSWGPTFVEGTCGVPGKYGVYTKLTGEILHWVKCHVEQCDHIDECKQEWKNEKK